MPRFAPTALHDPSSGQSTHALILAGGRGTRLHGLTEVRAKPAVAFAGVLRLLDFTLSNCINSGLTQVSVLSQYRADSIERHLGGAWWRLGGGEGCHVQMLRAVRPEGYAGTADAVHQHLAQLRKAGVRRVVVLAGDHVCKMDLRELLRSHQASRAEFTVATVEVPLAEAGAFGVVGIDSFGRVIDFQEKPARPRPIPGRFDMALVSMGIYVAEVGALEAILAEDADDPASCRDFGRDILPRAVAQRRVAAHDFGSSCVRRGGQAVYWRDVGTLDAYWRAHQELVEPQPQVDLFDAAWPLHTRPGTLLPARLGVGSGSLAASVTASLVCNGCRLDAAKVSGSVLSPDVHVGAGSTIENSVLLPGAVLGRRVTLRRAVVDEGCVLPDGLTVGVCADEDRARFHVTAAGVTLITPAMLQAAVPSMAAAAGSAAPVPPVRQPALRLAASVR